MKIAIATVQVPFITGGAELLTMMLRDELKKRGHQVDIVTIPFKWYPTSTLLDSMLHGRMLDLSEVNGEKIDMVIAMKFPAYYLKHDNKVVWLMHQHRQAYDLWGTEYGDLDKCIDGEQIKDIILQHDTAYLKEAKTIYTIAENTSKRLRHFNGLESKVLYHPPINHEKLHCNVYGDYIFYASRIDPMKRQRMLLEAAKYVKTDVKFIIAGAGSDREVNFLKEYIIQNKLEKRVSLVGFISEEEKINYYANCLGVYFGAYDEDYGYITLESFFSKKPVIVHKDAGGPLEFVIDGKNGFIIDTDPKVLANKIDYLYQNKIQAKTMGEDGFISLQEKNVNWDYVISKLLNE